MATTGNVRHEINDHGVGQCYCHVSRASSPPSPLPQTSHTFGMSYVLGVRTPANLPHFCLQFAREITSGPLRRSIQIGVGWLPQSGQRSLDDCGRFTSPPWRCPVYNIRFLFPMNLFTAGTDTSSSTIAWALAEMLANPAILRRAQAEMDAVGYLIPEGTRLLVNICAIGRDPAVWAEPARFDPGRFTTEKASKVEPLGSHFELIPFGAGRRICAGARMGVALVHHMLGALVHAFGWEVPEAQGAGMDMDDWTRSSDSRCRRRMADDEDNGFRQGASCPCYRVWRVIENERTPLTTLLKHSTMLLVMLPYLRPPSSAGFLFDEMRKKAAGTGEDPFRVLPDDLLEHILSFLPDDDALQTCVLDTQWRDLWRRKTSLHFMFEDCGEDYINFTEAEPLIEYVLKCRVEKLSICASDIWYEGILLDERFISRHLRTIEFGGVDLLGYSLDSSLNFSGCPVLEELTIHNCLVGTREICSKSLKHLWFTGQCVFSNENHTDIDAPRLISLEISNAEQLTPFLEEIPLLEKASIFLGRGCYNVCHGDWGCRCSDMKCLLLNGLSNAVDLKLISDPKLLIFKRDLEWCPKFDRLKTLTLNEWFTATDLVCILKNSPILEKLNLQLGNTKVHCYYASVRMYDNPLKSIHILGLHADGVCTAGHYI
uniref:Flavonoid 3',5'-hydroxylase 1 n=1 Tax=Aegilops tauschii TaxID=37682 RepID=R7W830_AEGTA